MRESVYLTVYHLQLELDCAVFWHSFHYNIRFFKSQINLYRLFNGISGGISMEFMKFFYLTI